MAQPRQAPIYATRTAGLVTYSVPLWSKIPVTRGPLSRKGYTAAQLAGLRYEKKVQRFLESRFDYFIPHLPFAFKADYNFQRQLAIPDGVLFSKRMDRIVVVEIKKTHTVDAWFQLNKLYWPVVSAAFPSQQIKLLEICQTFDPFNGVNVAYDLVVDLEMWLEQPNTSPYAIYNWTGRR